MALWTTTHDNHCMLGLCPADVMYLNEEQRNVHIWNSEDAGYSEDAPGPGAIPNRFRLVASFWVDSTHQAVSTRSVYVWLQSMCTRDGVNPISFWKRTHDPEQNAADFGLLQLPGDPRRGGPFPMVNQHLTQLRSIPASDHMLMQSGHYDTIFGQRPTMEKNLSSPSLRCWTGFAHFSSAGVLPVLCGLNS
ncbi:hypothetical protein B0H13DRAFT_1854856 [Mycena leptocephala]|nr:hypothetical protein B0H13DRAFT_1854856 [Mycena leptocephala]